MQKIRPFQNVGTALFFASLCYWHDKDDAFVSVIGAFVF